MESLPTLRTTLNERVLPGLDGCRAMAVGLVVVSHSGKEAFGDVGVAFFFVLSGFLITRLLLHELDATGRISLRRFYLRRTLRIFPAYYAFLALSIGWDLFRGDDRIRPAIAPALLYLTNYFNVAYDHPAISIAHTWSLAIEEQFYLLWPLALGWLARGGVRRIAWGLAIAIAGVFTWRCVAVLSLDLGRYYAYNALECRFDALALGCLVAVLLRHDAVLEAVDRWSAVGAAPLITIAALAALRLLGTDTFRFSAGMTIEATLLAVLLVQLLRLSQADAWGWLRWRPVAWLGLLSYPIYLYHQLGRGAAARLVDGDGALLLLSGAVVTVLLATASFYLIEKPFLRLRSRLDRPSEPDSQAAPAALGVA